MRSAAPKSANVCALAPDPESPPSRAAPPRTERIVRSVADRRAAFFDRAEARTEYLCAQLAAGRLLVKTEDQHIGRTLYIKGGRGDIKVLARCVMTITALLGEDSIAGRTFVDIGANIGSTTVSAMVGHPFADAVALEPEPENLLTLRLNLVLNAIDDRSAALQCAASNVCGEMQLVVNRGRSGRHWLAADGADLDNLGDNGSPITVPVVTLDSLQDEGVFDPRRVGLLWIDAENHEAQILDGASGLTALGVPALFEWDPEGLRRRGDADKLYSVIERHYTHYAKMRAEVAAGQPRFQLRPVAELTRLADSDEHFTDVLIMRLAPHQVPDTSLAEVLRAHTRPNDAPPDPLKLAAKRRREAKEVAAAPGPDAAS
jgi:FkbM family methyltransferase